MSYTPTEWHTGDLIVAEKLNNMENGVVSANDRLYFTRTQVDDTYRLTATWQEIKDAVVAHKRVCFSYHTSSSSVCSNDIHVRVDPIDHQYYVDVHTDVDNIYVATTADNYPVVNS